LLPATAVAVPVLQRWAVGSVAKGNPFAVPQVPITGVGVGVGVAEGVTEGVLDGRGFTPID